MTPAAKAFVRANDKRLVIEGWVLEPNPAKPARGATYKLSNGEPFTLSVEDCRSLPPGYPKWDI